MCLCVSGFFQDKTVRFYTIENRKNDWMTLLTGICCGWFSWCNALLTKPIAQNYVHQNCWHLKHAMILAHFFPMKTTLCREYLRDTLSIIRRFDVDPFNISQLLTMKQFYCIPIGDTLFNVESDLSSFTDSKSVSRYIAKVKLLTLKTLILPRPLSICHTERLLFFRFAQDKLSSWTGFLSHVRHETRMFGMVPPRRTRWYWLENLHVDHPYSMRRLLVRLWTCTTKGASILLMGDGLSLTGQCTLDSHRSMSLLS